MYITNITHLLDENGNIAAGMNVSGRKMASFLAMIIGHSTAQQEEEMTDIDIRCNKRGCHVNYFHPLFAYIKKWLYFCFQYDPPRIS